MAIKRLRKRLIRRLNFSKLIYELHSMMGLELGKQVQDVIHPEPGEILFEDQYMIVTCESCMINGGKMEMNVFVYYKPRININLSICIED